MTTHYRLLESSRDSLNPDLATGQTRYRTHGSAAGAAGIRSWASRDAGRTTGTAGLRAVSCCRGAGATPLVEVLSYPRLLWIRFYRALTLEVLTDGLESLGWTATRAPRSYGRASEGSRSTLMTRRVIVSGTEYSLPSTLAIPSRDKRRCMRNTVV